MNTATLLQKLREAVTAAEQPHYGDTDTQIDHLWDAIDIVKEVITELEKTSVQQ